MTRRGRKRRLVIEDEYWKLILDGVPTVAACRQVGIGRKTGYRWRILYRPFQVDSQALDSHRVGGLRRLPVDAGDPRSTMTTSTGGAECGSGSWAQTNPSPSARSPDRQR